MKKFVLILVAIIVICISAYALNVFSNSTTSSTTSTQTTSSVETTLSKEEVLKNHMESINKRMINILEERELLDAKYFGYINFQDFVKGTENNLSEYFFIGTKTFGLSQEYTDTKFYKNSDALNQLEKWNIIDADYLFVYLTKKKDVYGKENMCTTFAVIKENDDDTFNWTLFDTHEEWGLGAMIMSVAEEKCNVNH